MNECYYADFSEDEESKDEATTMAPLEGKVEDLVTFLFDKDLIEKKILTYGYNLVSLPLKDLTLPQIK